MLVVLWAFHIWPLLRWGNFLLFLFCWVFTMKGCWILSGAFSAPVKSMWFFVPLSVNVYHIGWFSCWPILASQRWIWLGHGVWSFQCANKFGFHVFCWGFLHLYSPGILFKGFLRWVRTVYPRLLFVIIILVNRMFSCQLLHLFITVSLLGGQTIYSNFLKMLDSELHIII